MEKLLLGDYVYAEATPAWTCLTKGTVRLGPAQIVDPEGMLSSVGGPSLQDIASATWRSNPGNWAKSLNPWKPTRGGVSEIESIFQKEGGGKWRVLLRGQTKTYTVVNVYLCPDTP